MRQNEVMLIQSKEKIETISMFYILEYFPFENSVKGTAKRGSKIIILKSKCRN